MLFDIPKDAVFATILVFSNIFGFPAEHWPPKWNKTVNFGCLLFTLKFKILKDFSNTLFALLETTFGQNFSKIEQYLGEKGHKKPKSGHFMDVESIRKNLKIFKITTTNAIQMKLATDIYLNKVFHFEKSWGITQKVQEDINKKTHKVAIKEILDPILTIS